MNNPNLPARAQQAQSRPGANTTVSLVVGAVVSVAALFFIARTVDFDRTLQALGTANVFLFGLAFLVQLAAMGFTILRWQTLLSPYPTRFLDMAQIYLSAHLLNTLLPAKLGTVARVLLASESEDLNAGLVFGSVALEKVLDTLVTLVLFVILSPFIPFPGWLREAFILSVVLVLGAVLLVASATRFRELLLTGVTRLEARVFKNSHRLATLTHGVIESLTNLTQRRELQGILFWTLCIWLAGGAVNLLVFAALGLDVSWSAMWFVMIVLQVGTRVPALPANLGVFHYLVILALGVYGAGESPALAFAILLHLIVFILPAFIGAATALPLSARLTALVTGGLTDRPAEGNEH